VVLEARAPDLAVLFRYQREEGPRIVDVELVRIQDAPPVAGLRLMAIVAEDLAAQALRERRGVLLERDDAPALCGEALDGLPGPVLTAVVEDVDRIAPGHGGAQRLLDDVGFVLHEHQAMDAHASSSAVRLTSSSGRSVERS